MSLDELRNDIIVRQKKGLPFIAASTVIWLLIAVVASMDIPLDLKNLLVFCCSAPLMPLAWLIGRGLGVNIFSNDNELGHLGFLFTMNQVLYLLIVIWAYNATPESMIMVHAMVFGAHLLPFSWLYKSRSYQFFAVIVPILSLILGNLFGGFAVAGTLTAVEIVFALSLWREVKTFEA
ncbi:DUF7010 family protein [Collinsella vaginalis]|uniref:DUF7010 family protein n=1 Tax=Collinsella vaginalis TaxID=1870987 RepID=UPI000A268CE0|nr:hypothetical protein [Collinsella vaginalis]